MAVRTIVIGAGSAGCIVAARLTEDPANEVVLLEAGPDYPDVHAAPDDIRSGFVMGGTQHDWGYQSEPLVPAGGSVTPGSTYGVVPVLRGKVVGGSSAVNGTSILRAIPSDFERWVEAGSPAWSWDQVLPVFRRLEDDPAPGEWHGQSGPVHVHRFEPATKPSSPPAPGSAIRSSTTTTPRARSAPGPSRSTRSTRSARAPR